MNRRRFLELLGAAAGGVLLARPGQAEIDCGDWVNGLQQCVVGIRSEVIHVPASEVGGQYLTQWCWAASIEMIFRYYGYVVPQERIVKETWGDIVNLPADASLILANLNRPWVDERGNRFLARGDALTANPVTAIQDLAQDRPLIIGTMGHAMVLTALTYLHDAYGRFQVIGAVVRDPWPGKGRRELSAMEWYATRFLARIRVEPVY